MTFTASNGVEIHQTDTSIGSRVSALDRDPAHTPGFPKAESIHTWLDPRQADALREFFQHEAGIWCDRETGALVFLNRVDGGARYVSIFLDGLMYGIHERDDLGGLQQSEVAKRFFESHPEPKPWHDANDNEVWVLTINGKEEAAMLYRDGEFETTKDTYRVSATCITDGRKIWPEES